MKQRPPADLQPALWPILALANHVADEPASGPDKQPQNEPDQPCLADKPVFFQSNSQTHHSPRGIRQPQRWPISPSWAGRRPRLSSLRLRHAAT